MTRVRIVCDSNFKKTEDVDRSIAKVLKMFSEHFVKKMAPLNEESDMECVYVYDDLTPEQVRLLKRLLNHNKTLLNFKEMIISKPGGSNSSSRSQSPARIESSIGSQSPARSESSLGSQSPARSTSSIGSQSEISARSESPAPSEISARSQSPTRTRGSFRGMKEPSRYLKVAEKLRELADEVEKLSV